MNLREHNTIDKYEFILIYLMLLFFSGFYFFEYMTTLGVILLSALIMFRGPLVRTSRRVVLVLCIFIVNIVVSEIMVTVINGYEQNTKVALATILFFIVAFLITIRVNVENFIENFIWCVLVISIVSIGAFLLGMVDFSLLTKLPFFENSAGRKGYFVLFAIVSDFTAAGMHRNQGIFWEPGAYQTILCLAYVFELSTNSRKPRRWVLTLFLITMATTLSTTGIIVGGLLLLYTLSRGRGARVFVKRIFIVVVAIAIISFILPRITGFLKYTLIDKVKMILEYAPGTQTDASSRVDSIIYPLAEFKKSPIWGIGSKGLENLVYVTCTPINWVVEYGILFAFCMVRGVYAFFNKLFNDKTDTIVCFAIFITSMLSEAFETNVLIICLCLYGYTLMDRRNNLEGISN